MSAAYGLGRCAEAREDYGQAIDSYNLALGIIGEGFSGIISDIHRAEFIGRSREPFQALIHLYLKLSKEENGGHLRARNIPPVRVSEGPVLSGVPGQARQKPAPAGAGFGRPRRGETQPGADRALEVALPGKPQPGRDGNGSKRGSSGSTTCWTPRFSIDTAPVIVRPGLPGRFPWISCKAGSWTTGRPFSNTSWGRRSPSSSASAEIPLHLIELPPARDLDDALTGFLSFLEDPSIPVAKGLPAAQRLYQILLAPV